MKAAGGGEIIQVQGGHIVRSVGRKDRHSKVYTAKGPRDRRVRLSAHTAIQFYDVQDRLGYDRPSKAVDWLMKKAKSSIDKLDELPPWNPAETLAAGEGCEEVNAMAERPESSDYCNFNLHGQLGENPNHNSPFAPPAIDSGAIVDTMKSFFPISSGTSSINFQSYPSDIIPRTTNPSENLCLSLHSFQNPDLMNSHHHHSPENTNHTNSGGDEALFDTNFQRMVGWNTTSFHPQFSSAFSQRGPLQSSFSPYDIHHQPSIFGSRFPADGLPGFFIPARIQGEEDHRVDSDKPSSDSPSS